MTESMAPFESNEHYLRVRRKLRMFFSRRVPPLAEELADEVMVRLVAYTKKHGPPEDVDKFALGIARNVCREDRRESARLPPAELTDICRPTPSPGADLNRMISSIAVKRLEPAEREALERYYTDGETAATLGKQLGLTDAGFRTYIFRMRRRLLRYIAEAKGESG